MSIKRVVCICLLIAIAPVLSGCGREVIYDVPELLPAAGVASDIAVVFRGEHYTQRLYEGFTTAYVEELWFEVNGVVDEVLVKPGDSVKAGDRLVTLDMKDKKERAQALEESIRRQTASNEYAFQMAGIDISILHVERQKLIASGASADAVRMKELEIRQKETDLRQQKEAFAHEISRSIQTLDVLREEISNDAIIAPFDGEIARGISVKKGSSVKAYDVIVQLADKSRVKLTTEYIAETAFRTATGGIYALIGDKRYEIRQDVMDEDEYLAQTLIGNTVYSNFTILGPEGWENEVEPGMYGAVVLVYNLLEDQLMIPANAVMSDADGKYVYVVGENGRRIKRSIKVRNYMDAIYSVVLEGLEEGERIYVMDK